MMQKILITFSVLVVSCITTAKLHAASDRPNFVIIFIDDMGYGDLSCYGNTAAQTPIIDRFASEGTRFTSFYAQTVCGPSRGALMTGRYPIRIGGGWTTNADEITIAEILNDAGYATGCVGKWDMSKRRYQEALVPNSQGFDQYFGPLGANDGGKVQLWRNREQLPTSKDMGSLTRRYTDEAIDFLTQHQEEPFFLYLAHTMMHVVIDASPEFRNRTGNGLYADTLEELDSETGRVLDALDRLGLRENTVVLFTSDNGPWSNDVKRQRAKNARHVKWTDGPKTPWGSAGPLRGAKATTWEGGIRVPGMVRWPNEVPADRVSDAMISTLDVLPTFAALAGAASPEDRPLDGVDQSELLLGRSDTSSREHFFYYEGDELQAVRDSTWKLRLPMLKTIRPWPEVDRGTKDVELYDLQADISESNNVAAANPNVVERLMQLSKTAPKKPVPVE